MWQQVLSWVSDDPDQQLVAGVCTLAHQCLEADGAVIALRTRGGEGELLAGSGCLAVHADEHQYTSGEGPGITAFLENRPVLISRLHTSHRRWPGFVELASATGINATFSFPVAVSGVPAATLDLYRAREGPLTCAQRVNADTLVELVAFAIASERDQLFDRLQNMQGHYNQVDLATGMLAEQLNLPLADASARLRARAFRRDRSPLQIATDILTGRLQLRR